MAGAVDEWEQAKQRRQDALWYVVVGVVLLFAAGFHWGLGAGGLVMVVYGAVRYGQSSARMAQLFDPWNDPEIDAWEQKAMRPEEE